MDCYTPLLDEALVFAADAFRQRRRKGSDIPYLAHLLQVMVTVAEYGGDQEQLIAALLHDYLEDIPGSSRELVASRFGERVAHLVEALSDTTVRPKPPWNDRKRRYLRHLAQAPIEVKLVSAADKLHNARSTRRDLRTVGEVVWDRFNPARDETLWYHRSVVVALANGWSHDLVDDLRAEVIGMHADVGLTCVFEPLETLLAVV